MHQTNRTGGIKKISLIFFGIVALYMILKITGVTKYLTLSHLQENKEMLHAMVTDNYWLVVICYMIMYALIIMVAFPGFPPLTLAGGFLFGTLPGAFFALIGSFTGSVISFFGIRYFMRKRMVDAYHDKLENFRAQVAHYGMANTLLMLHFLTIVPFFVINSLAAIANVPMVTFIWTTIVGSLPLLLVYSFAGKQLCMIENVRDIFSPIIISLFVLLIVLAVMPMLVRKYRTFGDQDL